jgi:Tfp pilus assembly protein PilV
MKDRMRNNSRITTQREHDYERGFTLLETAIAFTIMLVVGLAATSLFLYANSYNSGATDRALAMAVAKQQMEQLRNVQFDDALLTVPSGSTTVTSSSTVSNGGKNYTVSKTVDLVAANCTSCDASKRIIITVTPQDSNPLWGATPVTIVTLRTALGVGPYIK